MKRTIRFRALDVTGELKDYQATEITDQRGGRYMIVEQGAMAFLSSKDIRGKTCKVQRYLVSVAGFKNTLPTMAKVARAMNMPSSSIARAYKELMANVIVVKDEDAYILNPLIYWKGTQKQREVTIKRLQEQGVKL